MRLPSIAATIAGAISNSTSVTDTAAITNTTAIAAIAYTTSITDTATITDATAIAAITYATTIANTTPIADAATITNAIVTPQIAALPADVSLRRSLAVL